MARKSRLPRAADFFGGGEEERLEKSSEEREAARPRVRWPKVTQPEVPEPEVPEPQVSAPVAELVRRPEEEFEAALEAEKAAIQAALAPRLRSVRGAGGDKVTFYLPAELLKRLEVVRVRLLVEYNLKVGRSQIAQALLQDMEERLGEIAERVGKG